MRHLSGLFGVGSIARRIYRGFSVLLVLLATVAAYGALQVRGTTMLFDTFASAAKVADTTNDLQVLVAELQRTVDEFVTAGSAETKVEVTQRADAVRAHLEDLRTRVEDPARRRRVEVIQQRGRELADNLLTLYERVTLRQEVEDGLNYNDRDIRKGLTNLIGEGKSGFGAVLDRYLSARALTIRFATTGRDESKLRAELTMVGNLLAKLAPEVRGTDLSDPYDDVTGGLKRYAQDLDRLSNALSKRQEIATTIDRLSKEMRGAAKDVKQLTETVQDATRAAATETAGASRRWTLTLSLAGLCIAALVAFALARSITVPVRSLSEAMRQLAAGDTGVEVQGRERRDEVGQMAATVQVFKENAIEKERLKAEQKAAEEERRHREEVAQLDEERRREVQATQERAATEARRRELLALADRFESSVKLVVETVAESATDLQATAGALATAAEETSRQAGAVSVAAERTSTNVQTVATATEELSASIGEIGRQISQSTRIAQKAVEEANQTNETVQGLSDTAQKIGQIVDLINDIANQTNLLALNATIEAARAGEAGKGFAVVASEVKALATQTAKATDEIAGQIGAIQRVTGSAVAAIGSIRGTIAEVSEIATALAAAIEEQGAATEEIARNVQQAAQGTQEVSVNIGGVTQAAATTDAAVGQMQLSADGLGHQSGELKAEVEKFLASVRAT